MKILFSIISFGIVGLNFSQTWRKIDQSDLNVKYKLPSTWEVDGFGGGFDYWNMGGSSVCDCAGTINFGPDRKLGMVIYPMDSKSDMATRAYVWDYHFVSIEKKGSYSTKKITFTQTISTWEKPDPADYDLEMLNDEVWKFTVNNGNYGFVIYFWGDPSVVKENEKTIDKIMDSFIQVKK